MVVKVGRLALLGGSSGKCVYRFGKSGLAMSRSRCNMRSRGLLCGRERSFAGVSQLPPTTEGGFTDG
jgi:hypothetical protein